MIGKMGVGKGHYFARNYQHLICKRYTKTNYIVPLIWRIPSFSEVFCAFAGLEEAADVADDADQGIEGASRGFSQVYLEFGECHFNWIQIRRVLGEEEQLGAARPDSRFSIGAFAHREIVEDYHFARQQRRRELRLDVDVEGLTIHRAGDHPGSGQSTLSQAGDKGLGSPFAERCAGFEACPIPGPSAQAGHLGVHRGLVDEHQAAGIAAHVRLPIFDPDLAPFGNVSACAFRCHQLFFYM